MILTGDGQATPSALRADEPKMNVKPSKRKKRIKKETTAGRTTLNPRLLITISPPPLFRPLIISQCAALAQVCNSLEEQTL
jgi:hypothetical protein